MGVEWIHQRRRVNSQLVVYSYLVARVAWPTAGAAVALPLTLDCSLRRLCAWLVLTPVAIRSPPPRICLSTSHRRRLSSSSGSGAPPLLCFVAEQLTSVPLHLLGVGSPSLRRASGDVVPSWLSLLRRCFHATEDQGRGHHGDQMYPVLASVPMRFSRRGLY
jgi:hypothetical protein